MIERVLAPGPRGMLLAAVLLVMASATALWQLPHLQIDRSDARLVAADDPGWTALRDTERDFGSEQTIVIYLRSATLWTPARLHDISRLAETLEGVPGVTRVKTLLGATNIRDKGEFVDAGPLIDVIPKTAKELDGDRADALYGPLIRGQFLAADGLATAVYVSYRRDGLRVAGDLGLYDAVESLLVPLRGPFEEVFQLGWPRLNHEIDRGLRADLARTVPLALAILVVVVTLFLRAPRVVPIPLVTAALTTLWTLGFMAAVGIPITLLTAILPALIIVVGSVEDVHMIAAYLEGLPRGQPAAREAAIAHMAHHVGPALLLTTAMNVLGFAANVITSIPLIREFAIAAAFAMAANLAVTVLAMPILLKVFGPTQNRLGGVDGVPGGIVGPIVRVVERLGDRHGRWVIAAFALVVSALLTRVGDLRVDNDPMAYFRADHPFVRDAARVHDELVGLQNFSVTLRASTPGWFKTVDGLRAIGEVQRVVDGQGLYDRSTSLVDLMALMHQEMHQGDSQFHVAPSSQADFDLYLSDMPRSELASLVTDDFSTAQIIVRHNIADSVRLNRAVDDLQAIVPSMLGDRANVSFAGKNLMVNRAAESLMEGELQSLALILTVIFLLFSFLYTSWLAGALALVPNIIPILVNFGVMAWLGVPINPGTAMVAAIAIGLAVDDTIHLMSRFGAESRRLIDERAAVRATIRGEAVPVVTAAAALAAGFTVFGLSTFGIVAQFGLLAAGTMIYAALSDLLLMPILLRHLRLATLWDIVALRIDRKVIDRCPLFAGMSPYQVKKLVLLSDSVEFAAGQALIRQGEVSSGMYVLLRGEVEVVLETDGSLVRIDNGGPGDIFGEIGFAGEQVPRTATVRALGDVTAIRMEAPRAQKGLRFYPGLATRLHRNISVVLGRRLLESHHRLLQSRAEQDVRAQE